MRFVIAFAAAALLVAPALAADGTAPALPGTEDQGPGGGFWQLSRDEYVLNPIESVSISATDVWQDNRHRAYWSEGLLNVNGFLLFDLSGIPDGSAITGMTLRCWLENAFGSPNSNPVVDVYYSEDDGWTRNTAGPGSLSLDVLLVDDVPFTVYETYHDFELDVNAHDWAIDLADDQLCIGFTNDVTHYSYVYFFGAYGEPAGPPPELTITTGITPVDDGSWGRVKALY